MVPDTRSIEYTASSNLVNSIDNIGLFLKIFCAMIHGLISTHATVAWIQISHHFKITVLVGYIQEVDELENETTVRLGSVTVLQVAQ